MHLKFEKIRYKSKKLFSKCDDFCIVSYVFRCAENEYQLEKSKKYHLLVILASKLGISLQIRP